MGRSLTRPLILFRPKCNLISMMKGLVNGLPNDFVKMNVQCSSNQTQPHPLGATKDHQVPTSKQPAVLGSFHPLKVRPFFVFFFFQKVHLYERYQNYGYSQHQEQLQSNSFFGCFFVVPESDHCNNLFPIWGLNPCILEHVTWWVCSDETCEAAVHGVPPSGWFPAKKSSYLPYGCYIHVLVYTVWFMIFECDYCYKHNVHDVQYILYLHTSSI